MSKNIKLDLELPDFDKEITVSVTIKRDGEVLYSTSSPQPTSSVLSSSTPAFSGFKNTEAGQGWKREASSNPGVGFSGNCMDETY